MPVPAAKSECKRHDTTGTPLTQPIPFAFTSGLLVWPCLQNGRRAASKTPVSSSTVSWQRERDLLAVSASNIKTHFKSHSKTLVSTQIARSISLPQLVSSEQNKPCREEKGASLIKNVQCGLTSCRWWLCLPRMPRNFPRPERTLQP